MLRECFYKTPQPWKLIGVEHIVSAAAMENEVGAINRTLRTVLTHRQIEHFDHASKSVSIKQCKTVFHQDHQLAALHFLTSKSCTDTVLAGIDHRVNKSIRLFSRQSFLEAPEAD